MKIGKRRIGDGQPCYIVAEAGSNHNRDFDTACRLIEVAAAAGADAVKFQVFAAENLYSRQTPLPSYLKKRKLVRPGETLCDLIARLETPREWLPALVRACRRAGLTFLCTPFDLEAVDELEAVGVTAYKVASFEITHLPLLRRIARTGKPLILSTGMADLADIEEALRVWREAGGGEVALLHCAIAYPARPENLHLRAMDTLRQAFQVPVGFSDHTMGHDAAVAAVARGACLLEKHFTLSRAQEGPDHPFALEPAELTALVVAVRATEAALGSPVKQATPAEAELYRLARRSLVAARRIPRGTRLTPAMIAVKRPGYGIPTKFLDTVVGRVARRDIDEDEILTWEML